MRMITPENIKRIEKEAPRFIPAVEAAKRGMADVMMTLDAFAGEPELLYDCLWYATQCGVSVRFVPESET